MKNHLNPHKLAGPWINIFDRKILNDEHKCYGVQLVHTFHYPQEEGAIENEELMKDVPRVFEYMKSTNVGEDLVAEAAQFEDPELKEYAVEEPDLPPTEPLGDEVVKEADDYVRVGPPDEGRLMSFGYQIHSGL